MIMIRKLIEKYSGLRNRLYYWICYEFLNRGDEVLLGDRIKINYPEYVSLGDNVYLNDFVRIDMLKYNCHIDKPTIECEPELKIGMGTYIGCHTLIACANQVTIGKKVMISDRCFIGDTVHDHSDIQLPVMDQYVSSPGPVEIGDGSWLGVNVTVLANVTIGKNCVIGANSVVTRDIPDYHVAVGAPARIVRDISADSR